MANAINNEVLDIIPVSKWKEYFKFPTEGAIRQYIFNNTNNFKSVVLRVINGRQYVKVSAFNQWVEDTNK